MKLRTISIIVLSILTLFISPCHAANLEPGTFSIGGTSSLIFSQTDDSIDDDRRQASFNAEAGYFWFKNWEIGIESQIGFGDSDDFDYHAYQLTPFVSYHFSLNQDSNIYFRLGAEYGYSKFDIDNTEVKGQSTGIVGKLGYEYFLTDNIALDLGVLAVRYWEEDEVEGIATYYIDGYESYSEDFNEKTTSTRNTLTTQLKFKVYF